MTTESHVSIEIWPIEDLVPHPKNAKKHPPEQIEKLAKLITQLGWSQPIVVDADKVIIAGHGRRLAALKLGLKKVPVIWRRDLTKAQADALRLADNRSVSNDYDTDLLKGEIIRLDELGFDLSFTGFDAAELDFLTNDLAKMADDVFVEDVGEAVEEQRQENAGKTAAMDETASPVVDALGFKRVTIAQSRELRGYMTRIEASTGKKGAEALLAHLGETT